jgi:hypothetical protein
MRVHPLAVVTGLGLAWWLGGPVAGHFRAEAERRTKQKAFLADVEHCMASDLFKPKPYKVQSAWGTNYLPNDWACRRWARGRN